MAGVADAVREAGIACFGPSAAAAQLEGSKAFAKDVMAGAGVPTAAARVCRTPRRGGAALDEFGPPYVVKDDGLAAGKGVVVTEDRQPALDHAAACGRVVIEEFLDGPEVSLFAITDGTTVRAAAARPGLQARGDDDAGPNTGGMGAYTPLPWAPADLVDEVHRTVLQPTVDELAPAGHSVQRAAVRRARADRPRRAGDRVQRPLRRSGDPGAAGRGCGPRSAGCCTPRRPATWPSSRRWSGPTARRWPSCWPRRATRSPATGGVIGGLDGEPADGTMVIHAGTGAGRRRAG